MRLGVGAVSALNFLVGHAAWSFAAPIALVEGLERTRRPRLRAPGLVTAAVLDFLAAVLVWSDAGAAVIARALVGFASVSKMTPRPPGGFVQNTVLLALTIVLVVAATRGGRGPRPAAQGAVSAPARD